MIKSSDRLKAVHTYLGKESSLPESLFPPGADDDQGCLFMLSCVKDQILYVEESIELLTGYTSRQLMESGMNYWFSLIHTDDLPKLSEAIIKVHQLIVNEGFEKAAPEPLILLYRVRHANGHWVWIKDTRTLVLTGERQIDKILGKFESADAMVAASDLKSKLEEENLCTRILEVAIVHQNASGKQSIHQQGGTVKDPKGAKQFPKLTKREKEILQLIAQGLSTKMISDKCHISISTVETHRRHLLEKLHVKNSMELIKEASKVYWL